MEAAGQMVVGDSVLLNTKNDSRCLRLAMDRAGKKFTERTVRDGDGKIGFRIFCVAIVNPPAKRRAPAKGAR